MAGLGLSAAGLSRTTCHPGWAEVPGLHVWVRLRHFHILAEPHLQLIKGAALIILREWPLLANRSSLLYLTRRSAWTPGTGRLLMITDIFSRSDICILREYQGALFSGKRPGAPAGPGLQFPEPEQDYAPHASLEMGLPGGCGPSLGRYFRNARKNPLPAPKCLFTSSRPSTLQAKLKIRTQTHLRRRRRPDV